MGVKRLSSLDEANVKSVAHCTLKSKKPGEIDSPGLTKPAKRVRMKSKNEARAQFSTKPVLPSLLLNVQCPTGNVTPSQTPQSPEILPSTLPEVVEVPGLPAPELANVGWAWRNQLYGIRKVPISQPYIPGP